MAPHCVVKDIHSECEKMSIVKVGLYPLVVYPENHMSQVEFTGALHEAVPGMWDERCAGRERVVQRDLNGHQMGRGSG